MALIMVRKRVRKGLRAWQRDHIISLPNSSTPTLSEIVTQISPVESEILPVQKNLLVGYTVSFYYQ